MTDHGARARWLTPDLAVCLFLVSVPWMLFRETVDLWWLFDDPFHLRYAISHHPLDYLLKPEVWQQMPNHIFTPLLVVSYDTDVTLFGLNASAFYHRHLFVLTLFTLGLYVVLRRWFSVPAAAAATLLTLLGAPFPGWASQLMTRHYVESAIAAIAATLLFVRGVRRGDMRWSWLAGVAYFVAAAAKEVAIPLPAILLLLPEGNFRRRAKHLVPMAIALGVYIAWRRWMTGVFAGGYGWATDTVTLVRDLPRKMWAVFGANDTSGIALVVILVALSAFLVRRPRALAIAVVGALAATAVIVPVSTEMFPRYAVIPWMVLVLAAVAGTTLVPRHRAAAAAVLLLAIVLGAVEHAQAWRGALATAMRMSTEGRAFLGMWPGDVLRQPAVPPATMGEIRWLKEEMMRGPRGAAWTYDDIWFCSNGAGRVFGFDGTKVVEQQPPGCPRTIEDAPLRVALDHRDETLFWELGPYTTGRWRFILGDGVQAFDMPRRGGFQLIRVPGISMRVRYEAPAGWVTYSPPITMDFRTQKTLRWARP